jgi:cysteine desulfurase
MRAGALEHYANPSSPHEAGRASRKSLEECRAKLSDILGGGRIVFTSGATESNGIVLLSLIARQRMADVRGGSVRVIASAIEHASIHEQMGSLEALGIKKTLVPPGEDGIVDPERIVECLDPDTVMVSLMAVNNETGAVQRLGETVRAVRAYSSRKGRRIVIHADAAQAFGKLPFNPTELGIDAASISAHKIGGPRGIGALWLAPGVSLEPVSAGGGQEEGIRPGTENLPGIHGMTAAAQKRATAIERELETAYGKILRFMGALKGIPGIRFFPGSRTTRLPNTSGSFSPYILSFGFPPVPGEVLVRLSESKGFLIGTGSACASRKKSRTRVLECMGVHPDEAFCAVRVSIGPSTSGDDLESLAGVFAAEVPALRRFTKGRPT